MVKESSKSMTELQQLRDKKAPYQLKFPELFRSDTSIYPSYTNLKLPFQVICRKRKNAYKRMQTLRQQMEVHELSLRQVRAWDGVRVARLFSPHQGLTHRVSDPLTPKERQRLYRIL